MPTNSTHNRHFRNLRSASRKWDFYDAQPAAIREWFQQFPANVWPGASAPCTSDMIADAERKHLAGLRDIWGPDHPAVQDAAKRIAVRGHKIVELVTIDDLLADF